MNKKDYKRIIKECLWDMEIQGDELEKIVHSNDFTKKYFLFEKILLNSTHMLHDLRIFRKDELKEMLKGFKVPPFNSEYAARRKNLVEVYYFDQPLEIDELKWTA